MHSRRWLGFILLTLLIGAGVWSTSRATGTTPTGTQMLYIPQVGRAESAPADYLGLFYSAPPTYPPFPPPIPASEIYTLRGDGSERTRLTHNELYDEIPRWSPDGSLILWRQSAQPSSTTNGYESELWLMNSDGTNARNLTNLPGLEWGNWEPNGATIMFVSNDPDQPDPFRQESLYITTPDVLTPTLVISDTSLGSLNYSPDGTRLVFNVDDPEAIGTLRNLYLVNSDGTGLTLVSNNTNIASLSWSPDGTHFVFSSDDPEDIGTLRNLYLVNSDGTGLTLLANGIDQNTFVIWLVDSTGLLFDDNVSNGNGTSRNLYRINRDGSDLTLFVEGLAQNTSLIVSPDWEWFVYEKETAGNVDVYSIRVDGSETHRLTTSSAKEQFAGWVEGGERLLIRRETDESNNRAALDLVPVTGGTVTPFVADDGINRLSVVGISPSGTSVIFSLIGETEALYLQATDNLTTTQISPDHCTAPLCSILFAGWSPDQRQVAYTFVIVYTVGQISNTTYVVNVDSTSPTYSVPGYKNVGFGGWLTYGPWASVTYPYFYNEPLQLLNTRTLAQVALPNAEDGLHLFLSEWRYQP